MVTKEQGVYTGVNLPVVTEGSTFEELQVNIRDAVALYFEDENAASLGLAPPRQATSKR
jgi:predicted RNase H-like HicB family nuclease